ncbi:ABC transporter substrate-binding protein [Paenibacillus nanensis]|uniref:Probable sugar-binding periplasmic protein n=1 Tax=Paenibacillus nanensis TaxID=393251 RepID=A0A3A1VEW8_9BACL|nr:ABC transporter substrate-binding protein [Paenibacillus nanensis]RIX59459.1 ABC transporter substrate-binding protein [Paenibacillus nanensis]
MKHKRNTWKVWRPACCALMALLVMTACSSGSEERGQPVAETGAVTLEFWTPFSGGDNQFMSALVAAFNREHPGIAVTQVNSRLDDYYSRLRTAILSGNAPDVAVLHQTSLPQFVKNGYIEEMTKLAGEGGIEWDGFSAHALNAVTYDGKPYAVPLDTHALVLYYNLDHLQAAGLLDDAGKPILEEGAEGFLRFLGKLKEALPGNIAPLAEPSTRIDSVWLWWSFYNQMDGGGAFYDESASRAAIMNPKALEALEYVKKLYDNEYIPPNINDAFKLFYDGEAATLITGMWGTGAFEKADGLRFGAVPVPVIFDKPAVWGDSHTLALPIRHSSTPEQKQAALLFAQWVAEHGELWAEAGHVPSWRGSSESEAFTGLPFRSDYAKAVGDVAYWPRHPRQWTVIEYLIQEFEKMIYGQQSPAEALEAAAKRIDAELRK